VALGQYVRKSVIEEAWGQGFVDARLITGVSMGAGVEGEARRAARYLAKYVRKGMDDERILGMHRYDVGEGFAPAVEEYYGRNEYELLLQATERMGGVPHYVWRSQDVADWYGPAALWATWLG
jgi:hypothetical protein